MPSLRSYGIPFIGFHLEIMDFHPFRCGSKHESCTICQNSNDILKSKSPITRVGIATPPIPHSGVIINIQPAVACLQDCFRPCGHPDSQKKVNPYWHATSTDDNLRCRTSMFDLPWTVSVMYPGRLYNGVTQRKEGGRPGPL